MAKRLYRSKRGRVLGGVAAGLGEHLDTDPVLLRLIIVVGTFVTGGGLLLAYIVAWIIVPEGPVSDSVDTRSQGGDEDVGYRLKKSAEEMADTGARIARDVVAGIRSSKSSQHEGQTGAQGSSHRGEAGDSGGRSAGETAEEGGGSRVFGFLLVVVGGALLFNRLFYTVFRANISLPLILIALGAVVIASGRRR